jgi:hypothetical protein
MKGKRWLSMMGVIVAVALLAACGAAAPASERGTTTDSSGGRVPAAAPAPTMAPSLPYGDGGNKNEASLANPDRKVVQTANLSITVKDTAAVLEFVQGLATQWGGYIVSSTSWREGDQLRAQVTLRVPAGQIQDALKQIKARAIKVDNESISGQDVTQEYTDNESRLRNLRATETELLALLTTAREKTGKAEDVLAIFRELTSIREQIEMLQGRQQYLDTMTAMATISVDISPEPIEKPVVEPGWKPLKTLRDAFRALTETGKFIVDALIWLITYVVPVLAVIAAPIILVIWAVRRARRGKNVQSK